MDALSANAGLHLSVRTRRGRGASAHRDYIAVSADVLGRSPGIQQWSAAHEVAHVALRHRSVSEVVSIGVLTALIAVGVLADPGPGRPLPSAVFGAAAVLAVAVLLLAARRQRCLETQADRLAASWGYPVTQEVVAYLNATERRLARWRLFRPAREHPLPETRHGLAGPEQIRHETLTDSGIQEGTDG